jgi:S1-C subfamily serine protease
MTVSFYQHHLHKGYRIRLGPGDYTLSDLISRGMLPNDLSSLRIESGNHTIYLYRDDNFRNLLYTTSRTIEKFRHVGINDQVKSIRIVNNSPSPATPSPATPSRVPTSTTIYKNIRDSIVTLLGVNGNSKWTGSGFFIKRNNKFYIVTVAHNVITSNRNNKIRKVVVSISNKNKTGQNMAYECRILGVGALADIAVLEVLGSITNQTYLNWGNSRNTSPGDICYVLGDPKGLDAISITMGVVRDNKFTHNNSIELLSTDAQIESGNSGSPVVDSDGRIIGILSFSFGDSTSLSAGASQQIMEHVVNNIIDERQDYIGGILDIKAYPVDVIFLERYNILPGNLEGYYLSRLTNDTFTHKNMEIISGVKINNKVYKVGVYNNQYPLSSFVYNKPNKPNKPNTTILLEMKNIQTNKFRYESVSIKSVSINDDMMDGNILVNKLKT